MPALLAVVSACLFVVIGRVIWLQERTPANLAALVNASVRERALPAPRGDIMDRRGRLISATRFGYRAVLDPALLPEDADLSEVIMLSAEALGVEPEAFAERVERAVATNIERGWKPGFDKPARMTDTEVRAKLFQRVSDMLAGRTVRPPEPARFVRYVPLSGPLDEARIEALRGMDLPGVYLERLPVRDTAMSESAAPIVGKLADERKWTTGAEAVLYEDLLGEPGWVRWVRDGSGNPLWIASGELQPAFRGPEQRLSIDLEIQRIAADELQIAVEKADAAGGRAVVFDPDSGEVLAMLDVIREVSGAVEFPFVSAPQKGQRAAPMPAYSGPRRRFRFIVADPLRAEEPGAARQRCITDPYEPGSIFKPFAWAGLTDLGLVKDGEIFETGGQRRLSNGRVIRDVPDPAPRNWHEVLVNSSNIGMATVAERTTPARLRGVLTRFGFGGDSGLELIGERDGSVTPLTKWTTYTQQSVSFGQEITVTPVQLVRAFSAFARSGPLAGTIPAATILASSGDESSRVCERVVSPQAALAAREAMRETAARMEQVLARKEPDKKRRLYEIFGKSGTAQVPIPTPPAGKAWPAGVRGYLERQYISSFIAAGPTEDPRVVVLVMIEDPGPDLVSRNEYYGSHVAGPAARAIIERTLTYLAEPTIGREQIADSGRPAGLMAPDR